MKDQLEELLVGLIWSSAIQADLPYGPGRHIHASVRAVEDWLGDRLGRTTFFFQRERSRIAFLRAPRFFR